MLLLALTLAAAPPQTTVPTALLFEGSSVPNGPSQVTVTSVGFDAQTGIGGGWTVPVTFDPDVFAIAGQRPADSSPQILRAPETIGGVTQIALRSARMAEGRVVYTATIDSANPRDSVWLEDQLLIEAGEPVQGQPGFTYLAFRYVRTSTVDRILAEATITNGTFPDRRVYVELPSKAVLLAPGDLVGGSSQPVDRFDSSLVLSPDGTHWAAVARLGVNRRRVLVVDGSIVDFGSGFLAMAGLPVPPIIAAAGGTRWQQFIPHSINEDGRLMFTGVRDGDPADDFRLVIRGGLALDLPPDLLWSIGMDRRGTAFGKASLGLVTPYVERRRLTNLFGFLDVTGDGVADPNYSLTTSSRALLPDDDALSLFSATINLPGPPGTNSRSVVQLPDYRFDRAECDGVANSTGFSAEMAATGSSDATVNDVDLQAFQIPPMSVGYFLVSDMPGFVPNPAGSEGNLCLGGAIGRMTSQLFAAGTSGQVSAVLDTTAIPRPTFNVPATPGSTWYSQAWYRDSNNGVPTSNFSGAVSFTFDG
ncbi:MAG: hypothetical protein AAF726_16015 [Planctomycetota bacterium]